MAAPSGTDAAAKWASGLAQAQSRMAAGADSVTVSPGALAARAADRYLAGVQANVDKFKRNAGNVSTEAWREAYKTKGLPRVASGATAAQPAFAAVMDKLIPYMKQAQLPARGTMEQNIQRAVAQIRHNANFTK